MTIRPAQKQFMKDEDNQWTLGSPTITLKIRSPNVSTATSMATWQKNTDQKGRNKKHKHVSNATRRGILPKIAKENK